MVNGYTSSGLLQLYFLHPLEQIDSYLARAGTGLGLPYMNKKPGPDFRTSPTRLSDKPDKAKYPKIAQDHIKML